MARTCNAPDCTATLPADEIEAMDWRFLVFVGAGRDGGGLWARLVCPEHIDSQHPDLVLDVMYGQSMTDRLGRAGVVRSNRKAVQHVRLCYRSRIKAMARTWRERRRA